MLDLNDHRAIGQKQALFHFQEEAPGMVFWHPRGFALYRLLEDRARRFIARDGYKEVRSPQILSQSIWESSGHWSNFRENMFVFGEPSKPVALKPVSCPGHIQIVNRGSLSYRDLPLRLAEFGLVHRNEPAGALYGLFRLRQFTQDDGHIFCSADQIREEVAKFCRSLSGFYRAFGFDDFKVSFASRPPQRVGSDEDWDRAEAELSAGAEMGGLKCELSPGEGAFYGPKVELALRDRLGREWQCGTIQLDLQMPERFDVRYSDALGQRPRPAILHRALFGSLERFIGVLLEHHAGALPPWLAPVQVVVAPLGVEQRASAERLVAALPSLRTEIDARGESLSRRIVDAHAIGAPFIAVIGPREAAKGSVSLRDRSGDSREVSLENVVEVLSRACAEPGLE